MSERVGRLTVADVPEISHGSLQILKCCRPFQRHEDRLECVGWMGTIERARAVAKHLRTGMVHLNGASVDPAAPFGGYKQSGVGREWGASGIDEFLETKAIMGSPAA